jgi:hypothetical protein
MVVSTNTLANTDVMVGQENTPKHQRVFLIGGFDPPTKSDACRIMYAMNLIAKEACYAGATLEIVVLNSPLHNYFFGVDLRQSFVEELCRLYNHKGVTIRFHLCDDLHPVHTKIVHELGGGVLISPVRDSREDSAVAFWKWITPWFSWGVTIQSVVSYRSRWLIRAKQVRNAMHVGDWKLVEKMIPIGLFPYVKTAFSQEKESRLNFMLQCGNHENDVFF